MKRAPPKRPRAPPKPLMRFARTAIKEVIRRLNAIESDDKRDYLLARANDWPPYVAHMSKEEIEVVKLEAGAIVVEFNNSFSDKDGEGKIRF